VGIWRLSDKRGKLLGKIVLIEENYTNLLYRQDSYTNEDIHGEMGYYTHLQSSDSPTLSEILGMEDKEERELWLKAMDEEIEAL
jgi:hypothetical protein